MTQWTIVLWSAARQIAEEAQLPRELLPEEDVSPEDFFKSLRENDETMSALSYAACALPRLEAIEWALNALPPVQEDDPEYAKRMLLRDAAQRWISEPDDENRRAMFELADGSSSEWPETLIGLAIFFSGGSIAPEDLDAVPADPSIYTSLLSGALQSAVAATAKEDPGFAGRALDLADKMAAHGREAITAT